MFGQSRQSKQSLGRVFPHRSMWEVQFLSTKFSIAMFCRWLVQSFIFHNLNGQIIKSVSCSKKGFGASGGGGGDMTTCEEPQHLRLVHGASVVCFSRVSMQIKHTAAHIRRILKLHYTYIQKAQNCVSQCISSKKDILYQDGGPKSWLVNFHLNYFAFKDYYLLQNV